MNLLRARGLRKGYERRHGVLRRGARVNALDGVDLDIKAGAVLALVGESGSGKTTLARCLARLEQPDSGEIWFEEKRIAGLDGAELLSLRRKIQLVFQDPSSALNARFTAAEIVEEPLLVQGIGGRRERSRRAAGLMEQMGLPPALHRKFPLELSGGQRQRLALARALALEPSLLMLDEAFSALDLSVQAQLVNLLLDLQAAGGLTCLFVTHDLCLAAHVADEIAVMYQGRIVERETVADLFARARHPYTRALLEAIPNWQTRSS